MTRLAQRTAAASPRKTAFFSSLFAVSVFTQACELEQAFWAGEIRDAYSERPIAGVLVEGGAGQTARSNEIGRFQLDWNPDTNASISHDGYFPARIDASSARGRLLTIDLIPAAPSIASVDAHLANLTARREARDSSDDPALRPAVRSFLRTGRREGAPPRDGPVPEVAGRIAPLEAPPATIRIWRRQEGETDSCAAERIEVLEFEDYIKGVLPHEWIASWDEESLKAGSLAIRTYAWNWVANGGKYDCADLDDTTRSQVYRDDRIEVASEAVDATQGRGIIREGSLVSGEYSAENGDPTADGVEEALCTGREVMGHGRGMCQWGSQRWALEGQGYEWIATHYWSGSELSSPTTSEIDAGNLTDASVELHDAAPSDSGNTEAKDATSAIDAERPPDAAIPHRGSSGLRGGCSITTERHWISAWLPLLGALVSLVWREKRRACRHN